MAVMSSPGTSAALWSTLDRPWQVAFELAWQACRAGGVGVGAVLADTTGAIIGRGRNQRFSSGPAGGLLAHAEMEILAALPGRPDPGRTTALYTTLHPCPMCLGAIVVARVNRLHFGAHDPTWLGIERLPELNPEVRHRWPAVTGPLPGPLGDWAAVLPCLTTNGSLVRATEAFTPRRAHLARAVAARLGPGPGLPETTPDALERVWDLLVTSGS
jgi:tRNA(Arg) A34 adenosine deaminase TadA